jgi:hypothetical protein
MPWLFSIAYDSSDALLNTPALYRVKTFGGEGVDGACYYYSPGEPWVEVPLKLMEKILAAPNSLP